MLRPTLLASLAVALALPAASAHAGNGNPLNGAAKNTTTLAVIGDTPYGDAQRVAFPALVADVNADPKVRTVLHLGDIKNGSSTCDDARFADLKALYDTFEDPFVYTPGDNEWTDCHRPAAGGYLPTERLARLREVFFPQPRQALGGRPQRLVTQADDPAHAEYVENRLFVQSRAVISMLHVVGSDNDLAPWFGAAETAEQRALRLAEFERRQAADLAWLDRTFAVARQERAAGVVLAMQADTFVGAGSPGFTAVVRRIAELAGAFDGPVLLLQGDTHQYLTDRPLATGSAGYGITTRVPNLTRVVVEGETADEWLRLQIDPRSDALFSWTRQKP